MYLKEQPIPPPDDSLDGGNWPALDKLEVGVVDGPLSVDKVSELLPVSATFSKKVMSFFPEPLAVASLARGTLGLERLLEPRTKPPFSGRNPKKLSCGNGPDLVLILFKPNDDARIGDTEAEGDPELGFAVGSIWTSLPFPSFFFL